MSRARRDLSIRGSMAAAVAHRLPGPLGVGRQGEREGGRREGVEIAIECEMKKTRRERMGKVPRDGGKKKREIVREKNIVTMRERER